MHIRNLIRESNKIKIFSTSLLPLIPKGTGSKLCLFLNIHKKNQQYPASVFKLFTEKRVIIRNKRKVYSMGNLFQFRVNKTESPYWAFAIHDSHQINERLLPYLQLDEKTRFREEDPHTGCMAELPINQFLVSTSRFQLDINRKIEDAIYLHPDQAWGLNVWKDLPADLIVALQSVHTDTYRQIDTLIEETILHYGYFMIWDLHSYNAKRESPNQQIDTQANPQINLGTFYNHPKWRSVIERFIKSVSVQKFRDEPIDIRENVKFKGGYLAQHLTSKYGDKGCVLSIEFRKDFMDEWTGVPYMPLIQSYKQLLLHVLTDFKNDPIYAAG